MTTKLFEDEKGRCWEVTRTGSTLSVHGIRREVMLIDVARSCARRLGVTHLKNGAPIEYVNQHRRVWNCIWHQGETVED